MPEHPLTLRDPGLVLTILNSIDADNREDLKPTVEALATDIAELDDKGRSADTIKRAIRELLALGAIRHRLNRNGKSEGLEVTDFGEAYGLLDPLTPQDLTTFPWPRDDGDGDVRWDTPLLIWPDGAKEVIATMAAEGLAQLEDVAQAHDAAVEAIVHKIEDHRPRRNPLTGAPLQDRPPRH